MKLEKLNTVNFKVLENNEMKNLNGGDIGEQALTYNEGGMQGPFFTWDSNPETGGQIGPIGGKTN